MDLFLDSRGRGPLLLLIHVFVLKAAAADCPKPVGKQNLVLTDETLLMNSFPEGSAAGLECGHGYNPQTGSGIINCISGQWTEADLICTKKDCGVPKSQPHMTFDLSRGTLFGDTIKVTCDKGYQISGSSYKQCYPSGWTGRAKCEIATCEKPAALPNGRTLWDSEDEPKYGEIIPFVCDEGFALVGPRSIMCSDQGAYDRDPPVCQGLTTVESISTRAVTPTSGQASTSTDLPEISTTLITSSAAITPGGRGIMKAEGKTAAASVTVKPTSFQGRLDVVDSDAHTGYAPVIISVTCVSTVAVILMVFLHKFLQRRKGSYDTREDLKPELLQFQNL